MVTKEYLDDERKKLWVEVNSLKEALAKRTTDHENDARQASKKTSEYRNRSLDAKEAAEKALEEINTSKIEIDSTKNEITEKCREIEAFLEKLKSTNIEIDNFEENKGVLTTLFSEAESLKLKVTELNKISTQAEDLSSKINASYNQLNKRKTEFDEIYYEVIGYDDEAENGEKVRVGGLKDELENSYNELESKIEEATQTVIDVQKKVHHENEKFLEDERQKVNDKIKDWNTIHSTTLQEIKDLLPKALTAGLSYAFSEKREAEIKAGEKLTLVFNWSIAGLIIVSLIPFSVNAWMLNHGKTLEQVVLDLPNLLTGIIPLYIPLLWLAYSSNKKVNLSKRLVEEYTHKEVLSKTFEGLSSQIDSLEEDEISSELRIKLLYNLLDVSAENPGKLISDYNTADHPLMDALEKSSKLSDAVDKLQHVPGLSKIVKILDKKSKTLVKEQSQKVDEGLATVNKSDNSSTEELT